MAKLLRLSVLFLLLAWPAAAQDRKDVDLALAMAIDISGSIDPDEAQLQRQGYVQAFRDPVIVKAILGGSQRPHRRRLLRMVRRLVQRILIDWTLLDIGGGDRGLRQPPGRRADLDRAPHLDQRRHPLRHPAVRRQPLRGRAQGARHLGRRLEQRRRAGHRHAPRGAEGAHRHQRPADHERPAQPVRLPERGRSRQILPGLRHRRPALLRRGRAQLRGLPPRGAQEAAAGSGRHRPALRFRYRRPGPPARRHAARASSGSGASRRAVRSEEDYTKFVRPEYELGCDIGEKRSREFWQRRFGVTPD